MTKVTSHKTKPLRPILRAAVLFGLLCWSVTGLAKSYSDLLIVVDQDGAGYTAQLTIFADDGMIVSRVPQDREDLGTVFAGPSSAVYQRAHEKSPNKLTVISGSVFTRFRHEFTAAENSDDEEQNSLVPPVIRATLDGFAITMADAQSLVYRVTWVLPANIELLDSGAQDQRKNVPAGNWSNRDGSMVTFEQIGGSPVNLWLEYRVHGDTNPQQSCLSSVGPSEWCSPDTDNDGVPDYRDICLLSKSNAGSRSGGDQSAVQSQNDKVLSDESQFGTMRGNTTAAAKSDSLGCDNDRLIVLSQIEFESGQTYLNAKARAKLDTVATALQRVPEKLFLVASFTDNTGYFDNNLSISKDRAAAIRHYLMLRGVGPNQVQARGFGESQPTYDNNTAEGRRNNRRIELQMLN